MIIFSTLEITLIIISLPTNSVLCLQLGSPLKQCRLYNYHPHTDPESFYIKFFSSFHIDK